MVCKRMYLAQNFLKNPHLATSIVSLSSICKNDLVIEIGPGRGIFTRELAKRAAKIIAIEKDPKLVTQLRRHLVRFNNVDVCQADFLKYNIRQTPYKLFGNIPFNITSDIMRKILYSTDPPTDSYLLMQREAAERFSGGSITTQLSVLTRPWFDYYTIRKINRKEFNPVPNVDIVLLQIKKRSIPLIASAHSTLYKKFVKYGFGIPKKDLKLTYKKIFTHEQWKRLSKNLNFTLHSTPSQLTWEQWLGLFQYFLTIVPESKRVLV